jgi:hypothetical protein
MSDRRIAHLVADSIRFVAVGGRPVAEKRRLVHELDAFRTRFDAVEPADRRVAELCAIGFDSCAAPSSRPGLETVADVIADADAAGDRRMVHHWLATFATKIESDALVDYALPEDFDAFRRSTAVARIRAVAIRHDVSRFRGGPDGYVDLPSWLWWNRRCTISDAATRGLRGMLRLLLDHKGSEEQIAAEIDPYRQREAAHP